MQAWLILLCAGIAEIVWVVGLKYSAGFTKLPASVITLAALAVSMLLLGWATRTLPIGAAYAVWTGVGAIGAAIAGIVLFGESASPVRLICIAFIVVGVVGLKFSTPG